MSAPQIESETFSSVDAAWLHMDTTTNLAVIVGVISFDISPDFERLKHMFETRLLVHNRFKQRVSESESRWGRPVWEADPEFDIENHLIKLKLPEPADHQALQHLVGDLMSEPLDPSRPLWQFMLIENYQAGGALVCRIHHAIADGLVLVQLMLSIADTQSDVPEPVIQVEEEEEEIAEDGFLFRLLIPVIEAALMLNHAYRKTSAFIHKGMATISNPAQLMTTARLSVNLSKALAKLLLIPPDRKTILRGRCGTSKKTAWTTACSLDEVKDIAQMMGGTVNDILISAITGALRRYLEEHGEQVLGMNIRAVVPVNLRTSDAIDLSGNRFGLVFLSLPVGILDPLKRLVILRHRMNEIKNSPEAVVAMGILSAIGMTPTQIEHVIVTIFGMKGTAVMTNVPGPRQPLYFVGARIENLMFWVPMPGNLGLGVSIISYAGKVTLGVATDEGIIPDPESILKNFQDEMKFLRQWGRPRETKKARGEDTNHCQSITRSGYPCKNRPLPGSKYCRLHSG